jgi:hypothetical protein
LAGGAGAVTVTAEAGAALSEGTLTVTVGVEPAVEFGLSWPPPEAPMIMPSRRAPTPIAGLDFHHVDPRRGGFGGVGP